MNKPLRVAVIGAGAIGGYYGCMLARAGHDVHFVARSDLEYVREHGYEIRSTNETFQIKPAQVYSNPHKIGVVDLVIVALKATANSHYKELITPLVETKTLVLIMQNGMGNVETMAEHIPAVQILGGLCFVCINRVSPGVIENYLSGRVYIGEFMGSYRQRTIDLVTTFEEAGIECYFSKSLDATLWKKLCWNIPFNGLTIAAGGVTTQEIINDDSFRKLARLLMEEVRAAATAYGHSITDDFLEQQFTVTEGMADYKPSSLIDYLAGRDVEIEAIFGEPLRRGTEKGINMPHLESLYLLLKGLVASRQQA
ncbi:2-dehydropantoate 2-reductase [Rubellicoccus peritrichatus]|uniref:2-dehydropantoate 2-reductase n=1 Tax=Rubellicoccus peritrichatus TaxID=3080537 RepID=A0AAQ3LGA3_9BACT|nr:2-dehydropantoate 2-reductase [Puniceicoccus sp. CR14]WOO43330.1 2-dehydropantoate 2-reductase [Puniceicoccus sp. CR14]